MFRKNATHTNAPSDPNKLTRLSLLKLEYVPWRGLGTNPAGRDCSNGISCQPYQLVVPGIGLLNGTGLPNCRANAGTQMTKKVIFASDSDWAESEIMFMEESNKWF